VLVRLPGAALAAAVTLALAGCAGGAIGQDTPASSGQSFVGSSYALTMFQPGGRPVAPDVTGTTLTGRHLSLHSFRGSVLVVNFWGSWCGPCRAEAPDLTALAKNLGSRGVRFLGIDIRDDQVSADAFIQSFGVPYPSLNDPSDELALAFRGTVPPAAIPTTLVIDRSGRIAARVEGSVTYDRLRALIMDVARPGQAG
jgi:thiol-disulfide isomerase/thioredoxin